ncbi:MAG: TonB-dependent receptor [Hyphomonas sp.]
MKTNKTLTGILLSATILGGVPALAQSTDENSGPPQDAEARLKTVTVTSQKREENLQDVPISITAFQEDVIEAPGASDITSINGLVPNVVLQPQGLVPNVPSFSIRGITQSDPDPNSDPKISTFIDGVYVGFAASTMLDLFDIDRVEILKGPQGTLFGKNNLGGTVNVVTSRPKDEAGGSLRLTLGENGLRQARAKVDTGRFANDMLAAKLAVNLKEYDGYATNVITGSDLNTADVTAWRAALRFNPTDWIQSDLTIDDFDDTTIGPAMYIAPSATYNTAAQNGFNALPAAARSGNVRNVAVNFDPFVTTKTSGITWQTDFDIGEGMLTAVLGTRDLEYFNLGDFDGLTTPEPSFNVARDFKGDSRSAELRYVSPTGGFVDYVIGAFISNDEFSQENNVVSSAAVRSQSFVAQDAKSLAAFAQANLHFGEQWTLTLGGRYTEDEKDYSLRVLATVNGVTSTSFNGELDASWSNFNPRVALSYAPNDAMNLYAYYASGYKGGGFNSRGTIAENVGPYDEETVTTYEAGMKGNLLGGNFRYEVAVFQNQYEDLQSTTSRMGAQRVEAVITNIGEVETKGLEVALKWAATDNLTAGLNFGYLDAGYTDFCADVDGAFSASNAAIPRQCGPATVVTRNGVPVVPTNYNIPTDNTNIPLPGAPEYSGSFILDYSRTIGLGELGAHFDMRYTDDYMVGGRTLEPAFVRDAVTVMNASLSLAPSDAWLFNVYVNNLTDEELLVGINRNGTLPIMQFYGAPREAGFEVTYKF